MIIKIIKGVYLLFNILVVFALLRIHFFTKENDFSSALLYYTFPLPIIIFVIVLLSVFLGKFGKFNLLLAGALLLLWLGRSYKLNFPEKVTNTDLEIVFWNASRDNSFIEAFELNGGMPNVLVLTEASSLDVESLKRSFPEYHFYKSETDMIVFSKTPIQVVKEENSKYHTFMLFFKSGGLNFCAVDVQGSTDVPRSWELGFVNGLIKHDQNTIVLGDFNVPYESKYLNNLKNNFNHTFSEKGNGLRETWLWNLPLLSLDHIWASKDLKILQAEKLYTFKSDHNMIKTVVRK